MVFALDKSVGKVVKALKTKAILDNTIILLISDNGAGSEGPTHNHGSNAPLRGVTYNNI